MFNSLMFICDEEANFAHWLSCTSLHLLSHRDVKCVIVSHCPFPSIHTA